MTGPGVALAWLIPLGSDIGGAPCIPIPIPDLGCGVLITETLFEPEADGVAAPWAGLPADP